MPGFVLFGVHLGFWRYREREIYIYGPILGVALATICKVPPASSKLVFQPLNHVYTYLDLQTPKKVDPFGC